MGWQEIVVNNKILGHISAGVYRSAGSALKELVSNAYDAEATKVTITTNWPSFDIITCLDNGSGMTPKQFQGMMTGGIGDSSKRVHGDVTESGRHIIGRLGIGMLGIAQLCHEFKVVSHHRESRTAFQAVIKLIDFLREKIEQTDPDEVKQEPVDVGKFNIEPIEYDEKQAGTYFVAADMRAAFMRKFRETSERPLPSKFSKFLEIIHQTRSIKPLGDYWQMVWDMSLSCPIKYAEGYPFDWKKVRVHDEAEKFIKDFDQLQNTLNNQNFEVTIDGLTLYKPIALPMPSDASGEVFPIHFSSTIYNRPLRFFGYIYLQDGKAVEPFELRGLLIRIRNVAIGIYDPSYIKFPKIEGPRFNWLSGEVYVLDGLEDALNIDRDKFNELHAHYVKIQNVIHERMDKVFSAANSGVSKRSQTKHESDKKVRFSKVESLLAQEFGSRLDIVEVDTSDDLIVIDKEEGQMRINNRYSQLPRAHDKRETMQIVAIAYELSLQQKPEDQKTFFYTMLAKLLNA